MFSSISPYSQHFISSLLPTFPPGFLSPPYFFGPFLPPPYYVPPPSIKRTLSRVQKLTSYISLYTESRLADADTKTNCIWLISIVL